MGKEKSLAAKAAKLERFGDIPLSMPKIPDGFKIADFDGLKEQENLAKAMGLPLAPPPTCTEIKWPGERLGEISVEEISILLGQLGEASAYVSRAFAAAEAEREQWEWKYVHALEQRMYKHKVDGYVQSNKDMREAMADQEPDIRYRLVRFLRAAAIAKLLEGLLKSYNNYFQKLDAEMEMRKRAWAKART